MSTAANFPPSGPASWIAGRMNLVIKKTEPTQNSPAPMWITRRTIMKIWSNMGSGVRVVVVVSSDEKVRGNGAWRQEPGVQTRLLLRSRTRGVFTENSGH
jgi:hypothetical protein